VSTSLLSLLNILELTLNRSNLRIVNIIICMKINGSFLLDKFKEYFFISSIFNNEKSMKIKDVKNKVTLVINKSGTAISYGNKNHNDGIKYMHSLYRKIKERKMIEGDGKIISIYVANIVALMEVDKIIDLGLLSDEKENMFYEPEQFPAIIYRPKDSNIVCTIFSSGKISIVGAKKLNELNNVKKRIEKILVDY